MHLCEFCMSEPTFVSLCLFVCKFFFRVCARVWTHPQRAVHGGGSFMISSPKRYIKLSQTLLPFSLPLFASFPCSLSFFTSFLQLSSHCVLPALFTFLPFPARQCSPSLSSLSQLWIYTTFALISSQCSLIPSPFSSFFLLLSTLVHIVLLVSASFLHFCCCLFARQSPFSSLSCRKVMQWHEVNLWIETFKTTVSFIYRCAGINRSQAHEHTAGEA